MSFKDKISILFLLLVFIGMITITSVDGSDFDTIIEGADFGDKIVASGKGSFIFEYIRVDSLSEKAHLDDQAFLTRLSPGEEAVIHNQENIKLMFAFNGPKIYCEENTLNRLPTGRIYAQNWQWAYNGEKMDLFRLDGLRQDGLIVPRGSIRSDNVIPVDRYDPRYHGMNIFGTPVGSFLRGSFEDKKVEDLQLIGEEMQDDILCNVIRGNIVETGGKITVWLAPSLMYRPKHLEINSSDEIISVHNFFREHSGGIWFPERILKEEYYINESTGKKELYTRETLTIDKDFEPNVDIPSNLFEIEFPSGLMVYDYRTGQHIEIK